MNRIKYIAILTILLLSVAGVCVAQNTGWRATPKTVDKVKNYLAKLDKLGYNGAVLVAIDGKAVVSRGFGFSDEERRVKNSPQTVFDIGSVTKQFTAAAILKLEMQGKLSTADPITKYFERVPPDKASITIHELLRHAAGLPSVDAGSSLNRCWSVSASVWLAALSSAAISTKFRKPNSSKRFSARRSAFPSARGSVIRTSATACSPLLSKKFRYKPPSSTSTKISGSPPGWKRPATRVPVSTRT